MIEPPVTWEQLLDHLTAHTGMFVVEPYLVGADGLLWGYSTGRGDGVMERFRAWYGSTVEPAPGGYSNPVHTPFLIARRLFGKAPQDLDSVQSVEAVADLCAHIRRFLAQERNAP